MNDHGDIAGLGDAGDGLVHLFRWRGGVMQDLGLKGPFGPTTVTGIDNEGRVIGTYGHLNGDVGFLWDEGQVTRMPSSPRYINNRLQIVGGDGFTVWLWDNGTVTFISIPGAGAWPRGINERGQILLSTSITIPGAPEPVARVMLWDDGTLTDIGSLGGGDTAANDLNDRGMVAGSSETADGRSHAYVWRNGVMRDVGPPAGPVSEGFALNNRGEVAGRAVLQDGIWRPTVWSHGRMFDLGVDGRYTFSHAISESGSSAGVNTHLELATGEPFL